MHNKQKNPEWLYFFQGISINALITMDTLQFVILQEIESDNQKLKVKVTNDFTNILQ